MNDKTEREQDPPPLDATSQPGQGKSKTDSDLFLDIPEEDWHVLVLLAYSKSSGGKEAAESGRIGALSEEDRARLSYLLAELASEADSGEERTALDNQGTSVDEREKPTAQP